jgi:hypothetical protein
LKTIEHDWSYTHHHFCFPIIGVFTGRYSTQLSVSGKKIAKSSLAQN